MESQGHERTIAIIEPDRVLEIWDWILVNPIDAKEREVDLGKTVETRSGERGQECREAFHFERSRQQWGHYAIRRYEAKRTPSRLPYGGIVALLSGVVVIVIAATELWGRVPFAAILAGIALLITGSVLIVLAAKSISVARPAYDAVSLESLGIGGKVLGFSPEARAVTAIPVGYMRGVLKHELELDAPTGDWEGVEQYSITGNWYSCR